LRRWIEKNNEFQALVNLSSAEKRLVPIEGKETAWIPEPVWTRSKTGRFVIADFLVVQLVTVHFGLREKDESSVSE